VIRNGIFNFLQNTIIATFSQRSSDMN
jgi:hypothetical protein